MTVWLPRDPRLGNGLLWSGFVFMELDDPICFCVLPGQLDPSCFSGVSRSYTVTVPLVRVRKASPVRHQVRVR
jgi:hypothetical protein